MPQLMYKEARCHHCGLCEKPCTHPECQPFGRCLHICPENCLAVSGRKVSAAALAEELKKGTAVLGENFGGFTFSGGEPLLQKDFLTELLTLLQAYHLCIETSGYTDAETFQTVLGLLDFVIMDLKIADTESHLRYTGVENGRILTNFRLLQQSGKPFIVRTPLIPGITDTEENLSAVAKIVGDAVWEKIPYNEMAGAKYKMLGMTYQL